MEKVDILRNNFKILFHFTFEFLLSSSSPVLLSIWMIASCFVYPNLFSEVFSHKYSSIAVGLE